MYKRSGEIIGHLLLRCEVARIVWFWVFNCFGEWVMPQRVVGGISLLKRSACRSMIAGRLVDDFFLCNVLHVEGV